ncbi:hypothetical protein ACETK8_20400 (plasmid) [Brevundimonas staleyi]|uniref:Uncharacterized protein n=1 Tax=Brevundimonas staleyi TaxID=74326 RepID=A0ABW0FPV3_9CAUL
MPRAERQPAPLRRLVAGAASLAVLAAGDSGAALAAPASQTSSAVVGCTVTADDGHVFVDPTVASCKELYIPDHLCGTDAGQTTPICQKMNTLVSVDLKAPDMILAAHRGVFGMRLPISSSPPTSWDITLGGPPENSWPGVVWAQRAGLRFIEYDMLMMGVLSPEPVMTHYTDLRAFTDYAGPQDTPATGLDDCDGYLMCVTSPAPYILRDRDDTVDPNDDATLDTLQDFLAKLSSQYRRDPAGWNVVVILDLKYGRSLRQFRRTATGGARYSTIGFGGYFTPEEQEAESIDILVETLRLLNGEAADMAGHVVIKVPQESIPDIQKLFRAFAAAGLDARTVLWSPTPDPRPSTPQATVLSWLESWILLLQDKRRIGYWDTAIASNRSWMAKPFEGRYGHADDLMDYLYLLSARRSAIWTPDPSGPGGRHGNFAMTWYNADNDINDIRGDGVSDLYFSGSSHALVTSDRPDLFIQIRRFINANHAAAASAAQDVGR